MNDQVSADVRIHLKAYTRKGTEISGLYTTYLDMEVSAFDDSNKEIYAKSVASVKGINLDYKKAGLKALNDSEDRIRTEVAQDIIKHF